MTITKRSRVASKTPLDDRRPAFGTLVEMHADDLFRYARRLAGDDAEDVLQEALLRALRSYPRVEHAEHLRAWLFRITTTTAFDLSARRARRGEVLAPVPPDEAAEPADDGFAFEALIQDLPAGARATLTLRFVQDLEYDRIAKELGCTNAAARRRVSSAISLLRRRLS